VARAVALVGSYELLRMIIRGSQVPPGAAPGTGLEVDPLLERAAELFAGQLAADRVPSARAIRAQLHVGRARPPRPPSNPGGGLNPSGEALTGDSQLRPFWTML
jgi:hypothetical protein